jgi:1,2-diacylglycerol 3-alpha-glucosyltransferase
MEDLFPLLTGQFTDAYRPVLDGVVNTVHNYALWLNRIGGETVVAAPMTPDYDDDEEFRVLRFASLPTPGKSEYRVGVPGIDPAFNIEVDAIPFDIVHVHSPFVAGHLAVRVARRRRAPLVCTFHSKYRDDFSETLNSELLADIAVSRLARFWNTVDYLWVPSEAIVTTVRDYGYKGPYAVMPNGTDMRIPDEDTQRTLREAGRSRLGIAESAQVLLYVGQHRWVKNLAVVIDAFAEIHRKQPNTRLVFVGTGPNRKEMEAKVRQLGVQSAVQFAGAISDRDTLSQIYAAAELFIFPSYYDVAPLSVREAAAFAVPSLLLRGSTAATGFSDREDCFLAENSPQDVAAVVLGALGNRNLLKTAGEGARRDIYRHWEDVVREAHHQYIEVIRDYRRSNSGQWRRFAMRRRDASFSEQ